MISSLISWWSGSSKNSIDNSDHYPPQQSISTTQKEGFFNIIAGFIQLKLYEQVIINKFKRVWMQLNPESVERVYLYCEGFFVLNIIHDPEFKQDREKWKSTMQKMEELVIKVFEDLDNCLKGIAAGYLAEAGVPEFLTKKLGDPIYFGDEIYSRPADYLKHLVDIVDKNKIHHMLILEQLRRNILAAFEPYGKEISEQAPPEIQEFIARRVGEIREEVAIKMHVNT